MIRTPDISLKESGSVLLEGLIAILIFSFGILGLIGLQAVSMRSTTQAKERIDASFVANQRIAAMWVDRTNLAAYAETSTDISPTATTVANRTPLPKGTRTTTVSGDQATITVNWQLPGDASANSFVTVARVIGN